MGQPKPVDAEPADDHHQPGANVVNLVDVDAEQPGEGFLHDVFGFADLTQRPERDVEDVAAMLTPGPTEREIEVGYEIHVGTPMLWSTTTRSSPNKDGPGRRSVTSGGRCHSLRGVAVLS
jgi:hypothetical protein